MSTNHSTISILHQDEDMLVINKPPGLVVNRAQTVKDETVQDWMEKQLASSPTDKKNWQSLLPTDFNDSYGSPTEIFKQRTGLVHRLDKNTSGVMILAFNPGSLVNLLAQFRKRQVQKKYLCLVHGHLKVKDGEISARLGRARRDRKKFAVVSDGREAVTQYTVVGEYDGLSSFIDCPVFAQLEPQQLSLLKKNLRIYNQGFSLVECRPLTGRTHQIRVHLAHLQHPLVGDVTYVGRKRVKLDVMWCPRHFLHASQLQLSHPRTQKQVVYKAELWDDLVTVLSIFKH